MTWNICPRRTNAVLCLLTIALIQGCGRSDPHPDRPKVAAVKGSVTYKGKPLANANITFFPDGPGESGSGVTESDGSYFLSTYTRKDGAVIGSHVVTVSVPVPSDGPYVPGFDHLQKKSVIPQSYLDPKTSKLSVEVKEQAVNRIDLELVDTP